MPFDYEPDWMTFVRFLARKRSNEHRSLSAVLFSGASRSSAWTTKIDGKTLQGWTKCGGTRVFSSVHIQWKRLSTDTLHWNKNNLSSHKSDALAFWRSIPCVDIFVLVWGAWHREKQHYLLEPVHSAPKTHWEPPDNPTAALTSFVIDSQHSLWFCDNTPCRTGDFSHVHPIWFHVCFWVCNTCRACVVNEDSDSWEQGERKTAVQLCFFCTQYCRTGDLPAGSNPFEKRSTPWANRESKQDWR